MCQRQHRQQRICQCVRDVSTRSEFFPAKLCPSEFKIVSLHPHQRACGGIGRRARLRIWLFTQCRFESCQAHEQEGKGSYAPFPFMIRPCYQRQTVPSTAAFRPTGGYPEHLCLQSFFLQIPVFCSRSLSPLIC